MCGVIPADCGCSWPLCAARIACERDQEEGILRFPRGTRYLAAFGSAAMAAWGGSLGAAAATPGARAASCVARSPAQQLRTARVVFVGVMLPGPTAQIGGREVLLSPARMRVGGYVKGHGPSRVRVDTAVRRSADSEGIEPGPRQRWKIYSSSSGRPYTTTVCDGSRQVAMNRRGSRDARVLGTVEFCGGPPPGRCFVAHQKGYVTAYDSNDRKVVRVDASRGRFSFLLVPGHYKLVARYPGAGSAIHHVLARAWKTARARIVVAIR